MDDRLEACAPGKCGMAAQVAEGEERRRSVIARLGVLSSLVALFYCKPKVTLRYVAIAFGLCQETVGRMSSCRKTCAMEVSLRLVSLA